MRSQFAVVTGCSSGIGRAIAEELALSGLHVIATARNVSSIQDLAMSYNTMHILQLDVQDEKSIRSFKEQVSTICGGRLGYLINNAGVHYAAPAMELELSEVRNLFETNVFGVMRLCREFAPMLISGEGVIVQLGSVTKNVPVVWQSAYNASKAALSQYTDTLRVEIEPFGVQICEIVTGYVQSKILRHGLHMQSESLYSPIKHHMEALKTSGNQNGMPASEYARRVVSVVKKSNPPTQIWEGAKAWPLHIVVNYLPRWLQDRIWRWVFKTYLLSQ